MIFHSISETFFLDANKFKKTLKDTTAIERTKVILEVELVDPTIEPEWFCNDTKVTENER